MTAYEEFLSSPEFAAAFTAAYRGRHEPGDALWWLDHPASTAPSGAHSPVAGMAELKNSAFARNSDAATRESLVRLEAEASADRQATRDAIALARTPRVVDDASEPEHAASGAESRIRRRWELLLIVAIIALLVGGFAGRQLGLSSSRVILVGEPGPTVTQTLSPFTPTDPAMSDIFDSLQEDDDIPAVALDSVDPTTVRILGGHSASESPNGDFTAYAAELLPGTACLIIVFQATSSQSRTCASEQDMPDQGLMLSAQDDSFWALVYWNSNGRAQISGGRVGE